ncbi:hypothetical protein I5Q82_11015 [Acutalibacter muris]|uniref:Integrase catalytic domain-containing protein n=1 Tax=Acutalibacter muris TaxID=1796620 RepID=A0A1Z2XLR7_9FIRM|nr:hypothetical protein A4V00_19610 [Hungateiclostridiaceae bacterium KB18]ASB39363.1 hypothetical protein ADH66_01030 [Acutalibacter muris]QQR28652.1 hypothetical protein I5Q82_11015 [Acutalibacter muris]
MKAEFIHLRRFASRAQAQEGIFECIEAFL